PRRRPTALPRRLHGNDLPGAAAPRWALPRPARRELALPDPGGGAATARAPLSRRARRAASRPVRAVRSRAPGTAARADPRARAPAPRARGPQAGAGDPARALSQRRRRGLRQHAVERPGARPTREAGAPRGSERPGALRAAGGPARVPPRRA